MKGKLQLQCSVCGCTDDHACEPEGCYWVAPDLCSACADPDEDDGEAVIGFVFCAFTGAMTTLLTLWLWGWL